MYSAELDSHGALNCNDSSEKTTALKRLCKAQSKAKELSLFGLNKQRESCLSPRNLLHFTLAFVALRGGVGIMRAVVASM